MPLETNNVATTPLPASILDSTTIPEASPFLTAVKKGEASGIVVESRIDAGRGVVATLLVSRGTLKIGDIVVAGANWGRVKALLNYNGTRKSEAIPSEPVEILGLNSVPQAGDQFAVVKSEASLFTTAN